MLPGEKPDRTGATIVLITPLSERYHAQGMKAPGARLQERNAGYLKGTDQKAPRAADEHAPAAWRLYQHVKAQPHCGRGDRNQAADCSERRSMERVAAIHSSTYVREYDFPY